MKNDITFDKVLIEEYEKSVEHAKSIADKSSTNLELKEAKKNRLYLYSVPVASALVTVSLSGIAQFDPTILCTAASIVTGGCTIISVMKVKKQIEELNIEIDVLTKEYNDIISKHSFPKPTDEELKECKKIQLRKVNKNK